MKTLVDAVVYGIWVALFCHYAFFSSSPDHFAIAGLYFGVAYLLLTRRLG